MTEEGKWPKVEKHKGKEVSIEVKVSIWEGEGRMSEGEKRK